MKILVTNDDGYLSRGIKSLVSVMKQFGDVTVVAPKFHQSGVSMAVTLGFKPIAVRDMGIEDGVRWIYADATPASCVKFAIDNVFLDGKPDVVVSGVNHGSNAATAACYSATLGAAQEAAINGIPAIGVSLDDIRDDADFSGVEALLPSVFSRIVSSVRFSKGMYLNVNFPNLPASEIKGVRLTHMGLGHWEKEFERWDPAFFQKRGIDLSGYNIKPGEVVPEEGEDMYFMVGQFVDENDRDPSADHHVMKEGYVAVTVHNFDNTDFSAIERLRESGLEWNF